MSRLGISGAGSFSRKIWRSGLACANPYVSTWLAVAVFVLVVLVFLGNASTTHSQLAATTAAGHNAPTQAQQPGTAPTGASRCITCHPAEVAGYARSAMAHSLRRPVQEPDGVVTAHGYLVDIGGHLFQSPIAYYKSRQSYDLAPGFENQPDPDFTRPIREECVLCHSGNALHVSGTLNEYRSPVFPVSEEAITCER